MAPSYLDRRGVGARLYPESQASDAVASESVGRPEMDDVARETRARGARLSGKHDDPESAKALAHEASHSGGHVSVHAMDVGDDTSVRAAMAEIGSINIDVLLNVAGVLGSVKPELEVGSSDWAHWQDVFNIMTLGPLRVLQAALPLMSEGFRVINVSSQLAASTWSFGGLYPYVATKAALNRLMRSVAIDLKPKGIIVGLLHPGYVRTDMSGPDGDISPEESARGIRVTISKWGSEKSGDFLKWTGEQHPW